MTVTTLESGYDLNVLDRTGEYLALSPTNAPATGRNYYIRVVSLNILGENFVRQEATDMLTNRVAVRTKRAAWTAWNGAREVLAAARTVYVATTGSDTTGDGSQTKPWATITYALTQVASVADQAGLPVTIQLADGTYDGVASFPTTTGLIIILGNASDSTLVVIRPALANANWCIFSLGNTFAVSFSNITFDLNGTGAAAINVNGAGVYCEASNCRVKGNAAAAAASISATLIASLGAYLRVVNGWTVEAGTNFRRVARVTNGAFLAISAVTMSATAAALTAVFEATTAATISVSGVVTGTLTGPRYVVASGGKIAASVALATWGDAAGTCTGVGSSVGSTDINDLPADPTYTVSTLPTATAGKMIYVSDANGGGIPCFGDGTNYRRVDTREIVS